MIPPEFLADIIANPDDDFPRLACADWLEKYGRDLACQRLRYHLRYHLAPRRLSDCQCASCSDEGVQQFVVGLFRKEGLT